MMNTVFFDPNVSDDLRRKMIYEGQLVVCSPTPGSLALCEFAREMSEKAFAPLDPREAQHRYWTQPVKNGSHDYNYQEWNRTSRQIAAQQIGVDTRKQPRPEEPMELDPQIRVVAPVGSILLFSAAQMHSTVPNTSGRTRFSIDFRTVHSDDALARRGARNIDSDCTGTCMGDYLRGTDLVHVPEDIIAMYDTPPHPATAASVAEPAEARS